LAVACLAVAAALFIRLVLLGDLGTRLAYITLYPAVTIAAVIGGYRAGALATALCVLAAASWLSPLRDAADWLGLVVFVLACVLIVAVTEAMHRAQSRAVEAEAEARLARAVRDSEARLNRPRRLAI
jgi:two-component system CheB/CheR fusion protein